MGKQIYDDTELQAEHDALHEMACIIAEKWRGDLEKAECSYSTDGILSQYDTFWKCDYDAYKTLVDAHRKRIEQYREKKTKEKGQAK